MTALNPCAKQGNDSTKYNQPENLFKLKILIVDDEDSIRLVLKKILQKLGFEVITARNSSEALSKMRSSVEINAPIDFAILDIVMMGDISGIEINNRLLEINPYMRSIATTGYSPKDIEQNYRKYGFKAFLSKPYRIEEFKSVLSELNSI